MSFAIEVPGEASPLNLPELCRALGAATGSDNAQRQAAGQQLQAWESYPDFFSSLQVRTTRAGVRLSNHEVLTPLYLGCLPGQIAATPDPLSCRHPPEEWHRQVLAPRRGEERHQAAREGYHPVEITPRIRRGGGEDARPAQRSGGG